MMRRLSIAPRNSYDSLSLAESLQAEVICRMLFTLAWFYISLCNLNTRSTGRTMFTLYKLSASEVKFPFPEHTKFEQLTFGLRNTKRQGHRLTLMIARFIRFILATHKNHLDGLCLRRKRKVFSKLPYIGVIATRLASVGLSLMCKRAY